MSARNLRGFGWLNAEKAPLLPSASPSMQVPFVSVETIMDGTADFSCVFCSSLRRDDSVLVLLHIRFNSKCVVGVRAVIDKKFIPMHRQLIFERRWGLMCKYTIEGLFFDFFSSTMQEIHSLVTLTLFLGIIALFRRSFYFQIKVGSSSNSMCLGSRNTTAKRLRAASPSSSSGSFAKCFFLWSG